MLELHLAATRFFEGALHHLLRSDKPHRYHKVDRALQSLLPYELHKLVALSREEVPHVHD